MIRSRRQSGICRNHRQCPVRIDHEAGLQLDGGRNQLQITRTVRVVLPVDHYRGQCLDARGGDAGHGTADGAGHDGGDITPAFPQRIRIPGLA